MGRNEHHYVTVDDDLPLWTFLRTAKVMETERQITVDLQEVRRRLNAYLPMGFADEQEERPPENFRHIVVPIQAVYREWDIREPNLDRLRSYFGNASLRAKILPLEVEERVRRQPSILGRSAPKVRTAGETMLTLKKPTGPSSR